MYMIYMYMYSPSVLCLLFDSPPLPSLPPPFSTQYPMQGTGQHQRQVKRGGRTGHERANTRSNKAMVP